MRWVSACASTRRILFLDMGSPLAMPTDLAMTRVWSVGHSNRSAEDFISVLRAHEIELVADVRRFRGSRRHPQFGEQALERSLGDAGIGYVGLEALGGRRRMPTGPLQLGWRNASFRSYAAFTWTDEFACGLAQLQDLAQAQRTAMMCSEVLWWRCHRALIADVLCFLGYEVLHIAGTGAATGHPYTGPARLLDGELTYPAAGGTPLQMRLAGRARNDDCCAGQRFGAGLNSQNPTTD